MKYYKTTPKQGDYYNCIVQRLLMIAGEIIETPKPSFPSLNSDFENEILNLWEIDSKRAIAGEDLQSLILYAIKMAFFWGDSCFLHLNDGDKYKLRMLEFGAYDVTPEGQLKTIINGEQVVIAPEYFSILRFDRFDEYRGESAFAGVLGYLNDYQEIIHNYREAIKTSTKLNIVRYTTTKDMGSIASIFEKEDENGNELNTINEMRSAVESGGFVNLPEGEDMKVLADNRPAPEQTAFLEMLKTNISEAFGIPPEIAFDLSSLKGASTRLRTAEVNRFALKNRAIVERLMNEIFMRWIAKRYIARMGITDAKIISELIKPKWVFPAPLTVDERYSAQTALDLIDKGLMSRTEYCQANSKDFRQIQQQLADEDEYIKQVRGGKDNESIREN